MYIFGTRLRRQAEKVKVAVNHKKSKKVKKEGKASGQRCQKCDKKIASGQLLCESCMITTI